MPNNVDLRLFQIRMLAELGRNREARDMLAGTELLPRHENAVAEIEQVLS